MPLAFAKAFGAEGLKATYLLRPPCMHAKLHNLRLLYLAHEVEKTFEGLEKAFHRHLPEHLRAVLQPLFQGGPNHHKLEAKLKQLNAEVQAQEASVSVQDLLLALRDCERMAKDFYVRHVNDLSDPELIKIFHGMADEEGRHLEAVEQAITLAKGMEYGRS